MIPRRDLALLALIPAIYLSACCGVHALDAGPIHRPHAGQAPSRACVGTGTDGGGYAGA